MGGKQAAVGNDGCQTVGGIEGGCELRMAVSTSAHGEPSKRRGTFSADGLREGEGGEGGVIKLATRVSERPRGPNSDSTS